MILLSIGLAAAVAWYTFNVARVAWGEGNKGGAIAFGLLALFAFLFPTLTLLLRS